MFLTPLNIQSPSLLLYLLTTLLPPTLTTPPPAPSILASQNASPPASHPLSAILPPPPYFSITVSSSSANIPQRACLALTITALTDLAALPFNAHFDTARTAISAHFPGVRLRFAGPHDQGGLDVKYAVWGLTKAIRHMVEQYAYRESRFTLFWQGIAVGTVRFIKSSPGGAGDTRTIGANTTLPTRHQTQTLLPVNNQSEDGCLGDSLTYSATFVGRPIAFRDAMMAIIGGLTLTAVNDKDAWVDSRVFSGFFHSYGCKFVLVTPAIAPQPYYHVKSGLVTAMLQAAGMFYIFRSESRELRIVIVEERTTVIAAGSLVLRDVRDVGMDTLGIGRNNVSTS